MSDSDEKDLSKNINLMMELALHPYVMMAIIGLGALTRLPDLISVLLHGGDVNKILGSVAFGLGILATYFLFRRVDTIQREGLIDPLLRYAKPRKRRSRKKK